MAPLGLAILGSGIFAKEAHLPAIKQAGSLVQLKAIYSRSEKSAAGLAADAESILGLSTKPEVFFDSKPNGGVAALLARPDIQAVIVVLPITTQPSVILQALGAGKHVISEKPVGKDVKTGLELIEEYEKVYKPKGLVWRVAENFEVETGYQKAAQLIKEGKIGKVTFWNARVVNYIDQSSKWYNTPWRTVPDYQGGFLLDGGVHTIAALRVLLPSPKKSLVGFSSLNKEWLAPHDTINSVVQNVDGSHGLVELTWAAPVPSRSSEAGNGITITGTDGYLFATQVQVKDGGAPVGYLRLKFSLLKKDANGKEIGEVEETIDAKVDGVPQEIIRFAEAVNGKDDGLGSPRGALADVAFIQAALTSNGQLIDLLELAKSG